MVYYNATTKKIWQLMESAFGGGASMIFSYDSSQRLSISSNSTGASISAQGGIPNVDLSIQASGSLTLICGSDTGERVNLGPRVTYNFKDISEGADDSGGTGFRVLRVPNA